MSSSSGIVTRSSSSSSSTNVNNANAANSERDNINGTFRQRDISSISQDLVKHMEIIESAHHLTLFLYNFVFELSCLLINRPVQIMYDDLKSMLSEGDINRVPADVDIIVRTGLRACVLRAKSDSSTLSSLISNNAMENTTRNGTMAFRTLASYAEGIKKLNTFLMKTWTT